MFYNSGSRGLCGFFLRSLIFPAAASVFLTLVFPLICDRFGSCLSYYTFIAVSLVFFVPWVNWLLTESNGTVAGNEEAANRRYGFLWLPGRYVSEIGLQAGINIAGILPMILVTNAVASEGWIRSFYITLLLGCSGPMVFSLLNRIMLLTGHRRTILLFSVIVPLSVPLGLVLHHPFNYLDFVSPFYWISWSWIVTPANESLFYGLNGGFISVICSLISMRMK